MKSEFLSLKIMINELYFLKRTVIIQWKIKKKDLQLFETKLTEKITDSRNATEHTTNHL